MFIQKYGSAISFLLIIGAIYFSFYILTPNANYSTVSSPGEFSTERALAHLKEIAKKPHYVGSDEHKVVQDYIVSQLQELGLETHIQHQMAVNSKWRASVETQNILARIKGSNADGNALLLLTHYDSAVHSAIGASDAGSGVVTILEGLRAYLNTNKIPKNDIIILISDAEEIGLLGASAFVNEHPWAKDVKLVLNFEARGSGGPSYMLMETNGNNKNLIEQFQKANPKYPVATSLLYSIYKMLPNDTDLTVFREDGDIDGYNFAFIDDHFDYHTEQDNFERLDRKSLKHQASYIMPLLTYFADADLTKLKSETDDVYFNFPVIGMVFYPFSWVVPMVILISLLFFVLFYYAIAKKKIYSKHVTKGIFVFLKYLIFSGLVTYFGWKFLQVLHPQYQEVQHGFTYNGHTYIAGFVALTIAIGFLFYSKLRDKIAPENLLITPVVVWILINITIAIYLKGAGYFIIAPLYGIIALTILLFSRRAIQNQQLILSLLSIPMLILFAPMIQMFPVGLGLKMIVVSSIFTVLLFTTMIPIFLWYKNGKRLGKLFLIVALLLFISASFTADYTEDRKKPNSIVYVLDADLQKAFWASYDKKTDEYTSQFLGNDPAKGGYDPFTTASKYKTKIQLHKETEVKAIPAPNVYVNYDTIIGDSRNISITIIPQRKVNRIELLTLDTIHFKKFDINGIDLRKKKNDQYVFTTEKRNQILTHYFTKEGEDVKIWFSIPKEENPEIFINEVSYNLYESPLFNIRPRNKTMMPKPFIINDAIIVKKQIDLLKN